MKYSVVNGEIESAHLRWLLNDELWPISWEAISFAETNPMSDELEVEELLQELNREGHLSSEGRFTLSPEKLREKLASFQFERPSQWILKVVQGLVASKATEISIKVSRNRTDISYSVPDSGWSIQELQSAFLEPENGSSKALQHLRAALWFISFNLKLNWSACFAQSDSMLNWADGNLQLFAKSPPDKSSFEILHPQAIFHSNSLGPDWAANLSRELSLNAYCCPVPLSLDGLRIDNLLLCPTLTQPRVVTPSKVLPITESVHLIAAGWGQSEGDRTLKVPPATPNRAADGFGTTAFSHPPSGPVDWMAILVAHITLNKDGPRQHFVPSNSASLMSWISEGVIVRQLELDTDSGLNCHLFVSAAGQDCDISGLRLTESGENSPLLKATLKEVGQWLAQQTVSFDRRKATAIRTKKMIAAGFGVLSAALTGLAGMSGHLDPAIAISFGLPATLMLFGHKDDSEALREAFEIEAERLQGQWRNRVCDNEA